MGAWLAGRGGGRARGAHRRFGHRRRIRDRFFFFSDLSTVPVLSEYFVLLVATLETSFCHISFIERSSRIVYYTMRWHHTVSLLDMTSEEILIHAFCEVND